MNDETQLENDFIAKLVALKYTYRSDIRTIPALNANFRQQFETLNKVRLSDHEFDRLMETIITPDVFVNAKHLRGTNSFERDDGTPLHYTLVNTKDWCKNRYEVINQPRVHHDASHHRYDVVLLINGIPMVQVELKRLSISPRRAMQQIVNYKKDVGNGYTNTLMAFVQMFIVSNRTNTYYFANNNNRHFAFGADEHFLPIYQWANPDNRKISHLHEFADTFLAKCTLGQMISRYMVLVENEQKMLMMRPYQIYAVKAIVDCIEKNQGNGYIWHTTGSGKTLTSFKASTLLKADPNIEKCLFVVDRKDLDRQTREEFNKFQENCVEENTNTGALVERLLSTDYTDKVIVTTIQKLGLALDPTNKNNYKEQLKPLADKRMVFIFDECHRSQFGDNHQAIKQFFPNAQLFGFTGTPIFEQNASYTLVTGENARFKTTKDVFANRLHEYTITNAIEDKNVLSFHVDYYKPDIAPDADTDTDINETKNAKPTQYKPPYEAVVNAILDKHDQATDSRRFNAVFATASIDDAITYYQTFKTVQAERVAELQAQSLANAADTHTPIHLQDWQPLNIACVFSPPSDGNKDVIQLQEDLIQEKEDNKHNPAEKKQALSQIIADYNQQYRTNHQISQFDGYYQDVQGRIKNQKYPNSDYPHANKIDITIVVDMLLTGFDSKYLNTLYVDKNLKHHGLIQAFSRTNRVLNDTKPWGNVVVFRPLETNVDEAIKLFSGGKDEDAKKVWLVDPAPVVIADFQQAVQTLKQLMQTHGLDAVPHEVVNLKGDTAKAEFAKAFKEVRRLKTQLDQYTDLTDTQSQDVEAMMPKETLQGFQGAYLDVATELKAKQDAKQDRPDASDADSDDDKQAIDQLDFEFVLFSSAIIDYDYIMALIARYAQETDSDKRAMNRQELVDLLASQSNLRDEQDDIIAYVDSLTLDIEPLTLDEIKKGYQAFKAQRASAELDHIATTHGIDATQLRAMVERVLWRKVFDGEALTELLKPLELGWKARMRAEMALMEDLLPLIKKRAEGQEISGLSAYED